MKANTPSQLTFTVASHYQQSNEFWLAHNGYTIMVIAPPFFREHHRNLPLFAATKQIVFGNLRPEVYAAQFRPIMQARIPAVKQWIADHQGEHMYLLCACSVKKETDFCHRLLIAKYLIWLGCREIPFVHINEKEIPLSFEDTPFFA